MIVERTHYYAKPGRAVDVLATRRRASEIRVRLGLARGVILVAAGHEGDGPDVAWEGAFESPEAHTRDLEVRAASEEFAAVRAEMGSLLVRFERHLWSRDEAARPGTGAPGVSPAPDRWPSGDDLARRPIVPQVVTFPSASLALTGYLYVPPGAAGATRRSCPTDEATEARRAWRGVKRSRTRSGHPNTTPASRAGSTGRATTSWPPSISWPAFPRSIPAASA